MGILAAAAAAALAESPRHTNEAAESNSESNANPNNNNAQGGSYDVRGSTYREARANAEDPNVNGNPGGYPGYTLVKYKSGEYRTQVVSLRKVRGGYQVTVRVTSIGKAYIESITIRLPNWVDYSSASQEDKDAWDAWITSLRNHENDHAAIGRAYLPTIQRGLNQDIGATATGMGKDIKSAIDNASNNIRLTNFNRAVEQAQNRQNALDDVTDHGRNPVPQNFRLGPP
jgi:predicted secreted Zn-dependent protease